MLRWFLRVAAVIIHRLYAVPGRDKSARDASFKGLIVQRTHRSMKNFRGQLDRKTSSWYHISIFFNFKYQKDVYLVYVCILCTVL